MAKFQKTSLQLPPAVLDSIAPWPGLTQSEALRLSVERGRYLSCLNSEEIAAVAHRYKPILTGALEDLDYGDYRLAARSLPDIVAGFLREESTSWQDERGGTLEEDQLLDALRKMNVLERIGVLDCIVAERKRNAERSIKEARLPNASDFEAEIRRLWEQSETAGATQVDIKAGDVHRKLGGYPAPNNRMPDCCQVMKRLMRGRDQVVSGPPKGAGASLVIQYILPRDERSSGATGKVSR